MATKDRFFVVIWQSEGKSGTINMISHNGNYLNRAGAVRLILEYNKNVSKAIITNVWELSEEDYKTWTTEEID